MKYSIDGFELEKGKQQFMDIWILGLGYLHSFNITESGNYPFRGLDRMLVTLQWSVPQGSAS